MKNICLNSFLKRIVYVQGSGKYVIKNGIQYVEGPQNEHSVCLLRQRKIKISPGAGSKKYFLGQKKEKVMILLG